MKPKMFWPHVNCKQPERAAPRSPVTPRVRKMTPGKVPAIEESGACHAGSSRIACKAGATIRIATHAASGTTNKPQSEPISVPLDAHIFKKRISSCTALGFLFCEQTLQFGDPAFIIELVHNVGQERITKIGDQRA